MDAINFLALDILVAVVISVAAIIDDKPMQPTVIKQPVTTSSLAPSTPTASLTPVTQPKD